MTAAAVPACPRYHWTCGWTTSTTASTARAAPSAVLLDDRGYVALLRLRLARSGYASGPLFRLTGSADDFRHPCRRLRTLTPGALAEHFADFLAFPA